MNREKIKIIRKAKDDLVNLTANMNSGTDRLPNTFFDAGGYKQYQEFSNMYKGWLSRKIVDIVPTEALKKGWQIVCPSWKPDKIEMLKKYQEYLKLPDLILRAFKSERVFGGSIILALTDATWGAMKNPIPDFLPQKTLLKLQMFDAWQAYAAEVNLTNPLADDYLLPTTYTIGSTGLNSYSSGAEKTFMDGSVVHNSRTERFDGEWLPWYEFSTNMYWGQSILSVVYNAVRNAGIVDDATASLIFRASVPVMKVKDLVDIVSDPEAQSAFLRRMNILNYQMSNNNMAIIDQEEELDNLETGQISGLDSTLERFYVTCSSASGIPVTKLVGESARGLNATGEGDLDNYYDMLESYQQNKIKPHLIDIYKRWIIPSLFDEKMPVDFDVVFPELERESPSKRQEMDRQALDMIITAMDSNLIDTKIARQELVERKVFKNFTSEDIKRMEEEKEENEMEFNDALDMAEKTYKENDDE